MVRHFSQSEHPLLKRWLVGTTCYRGYVRRSVLFENQTHIVFKHNSHASYVDRMRGSCTCQAYAALYRKSDLALDSRQYNRNLFLGGGDLARWEGRISSARILADCKAMGIVFGAAEIPKEMLS